MCTEHDFSELTQDDVEMEIGTKAGQLKMPYRLFLASLPPSSFVRTGVSPPTNAHWLCVAIPRDGKFPAQK